MSDKEGSEDSDLLNRVLDEIAGFNVQLESDPTLPHLGTAYLQRSLAACRGYLNRLSYYMQSVGKAERDLKVEVRQAEMDFELKVGGLLADDPVVRSQPSIEDRKALAAAKLAAENLELSKLRLRLLEVQETMKLVRMKYRDMQQVSQDVKLQRQMVKDDKEVWGSGGGGYVPPGTKQDKSIEGGLPPPVRPRINPSDLLDPERRPEDLPVPVDSVHAEQIAEFFNRDLQSAPEAPEKAPEAPFEPPPPMMRYEDLLAD